MYTGEDCESTDEITITVFDLPNVSANANYENICVGHYISLTGGGAETYSWEPAPIMDGISFIPGPVGTYTYSVLGTDLNGCSNESTVEVVVHEEISITSVITEEIVFGEGAIDITVTGGVTPYSFDWDNDGTGDFDDTEDLTGLTSGFYTVTVNGATGCSASSVIVLDSQLGISESTDVKLNVYPNPTTSIITIEYEGTFNYTLITINGDIIKQATATDKTQISLESFASGVYFVSVNTNDTTQTIKLVKN
jgi:hypothetical protein